MSHDETRDERHVDPPRLDVAPRPWNYNPSSWPQRIPICLLAMVGFFLAVYMGLYQWDLIETVWDPFFSGRDGKNGSETVLKSPLSHRMTWWFLVPDASFGAVAYLGDAVFGLAGSTRRWQYRPWMVILFGIDVIPLGIVSAILVACQGDVVGAWCFLCLVTAVVSILLVFFAYDEVWSCLIYLRRVRSETGNGRILWKTFWGIPTPQAHRIAEAMVNSPAAQS